MSVTHLLYVIGEIKHFVTEWQTSGHRLPLYVKFTKTSLKPVQNVQAYYVNLHSPLAYETVGRCHLQSLSNTGIHFNKKLVK